MVPRMTFDEQLALRVKSLVDERCRFNALGEESRIARLVEARVEVLFAEKLKTITPCSACRPRSPTPVAPEPPRQPGYIRPDPGPMLPIESYFRDTLAEYSCFLSARGVVFGREARNVAVEMLHIPEPESFENFVNPRSDIVNWNFDFLDRLVLVPGDPFSPLREQQMHLLLDHHLSVLLYSRWAGVIVYKGFDKCIDALRRLDDSPPPELHLPPLDPRKIVPPIASPIIGAVRLWDERPELLPSTPSINGAERGHGSEETDEEGEGGDRGGNEAGRIEAGRSEVGRGGPPGPWVLGKSVT